MAFSVSYVYEILDRYSAPLRRIAAETQRFTSMAQSAPPAVERMNAAMGGLAALGIGAFLKEATEKSLEFDDAMQDLAKNVPAEQLAGFSARFKDMSVEMGKSAVGLAQIAYEGSKMGLAGADLDRFTTTVAKVSTAFEMSDQAAGAAIGSINAKLGMSVDQVTNLMAKVNYLADNFTSDGGRMIEIIQRTSGTMATLKMPDTLIAGLASFADTLETSPELAASGLNMMFGKMMQNKKLMTGLLSDPQKTIAAELQKYRDMTPVKRAAKIFEDYGAEAGRFVLKAVEQAGQLNEMIEKAGSSKALASLDAEFANRLGRASTVVARMKSGFEDMMVTIGDNIKMVIADFGPFTMEVMNNVRAFMTANPVLVKAGVAFLGILAAATAVAGVMALVVGAISVPILAVAAAIAGLIALYPQWEASGHPVVAQLQALWAKLQLAGQEIGVLVGKIMELFGVSSGANFDWIDAIGRGFTAALLPLQIMMNGLRGVVQAAIAVSNADFSGAADAMTNAYKNSFEDIQATWQTVIAPMAAVQQGKTAAVAPVASVAPTSAAVAAATAPAAAAQPLTDAQLSQISSAVKTGMENANVTAQVNGSPASAPLPTGANAPTGR